jgi:hypothetical protein
METNITFTTIQFAIGLITFAGVMGISWGRLGNRVTQVEKNFEKMEKQISALSQLIITSIVDKRV